MAEPMSDERLDQIRHDLGPGIVYVSGLSGTAHLRVACELLAEVERLRARLDEIGEPGTLWGNEFDGVVTPAESSNVARVEEMCGHGRVMQRDVRFVGTWVWTTFDGNRPVAMPQRQTGYATGGVITAEQAEAIGRQIQRNSAGCVIDASGAQTGEAGYGDGEGDRG